MSGLRELLREIDATDKRTKRLLRDDLRQAAEPVRAFAAQEFAYYDARTARNFRISVRKTGVVSVDQRLRKTTRKRPDFGQLQMRKALIPGLIREQPRVIRRMEEAVERITEKVQRSTGVR